MSEMPVKTWFEREGKLLRLRLARPKANIIDAGMVAALDAALSDHLDNANLCAVLLDHEGGHFSFGASVEEHLPDQCADMLSRFHALIGRILASPVPFLVAVRGQCLGGGLEVASAGHLVFAAPDARFGQPEIQLGVIAPAASCLLPERIGRAHAEDLLFSGRSVTADEAAAMGLVNAIGDDPEAVALAYFDEHLSAKSGSSLRYAVRAAREDWVEGVMIRLAKVEKLYLDGLMTTEDAAEGLEAFIDKRPAKWRNR